MKQEDLETKQNNRKNLKSIGIDCASLVGGFGAVVDIPVTDLKDQINPGDCYNLSKLCVSQIMA